MASWVSRWSCTVTLAYVTSFARSADLRLTETYSSSHLLRRRLRLIDLLGIVRCDKFDALLVDYVHPRKFPKLGPTLTWVLRATTVGVLVGVYQFNTEDIGQYFRFYHLQRITDPNAFVFQVLRSWWPRHGTLDVVLPSLNWRRHGLSLSHCSSIRASNKNQKK